jgi:predicted enzyme related to lactoylglutathione lyase
MTTKVVGIIVIVLMAAVVVNSGRSGGMVERQMPQEPIMIYAGVDSVTEYSNKVERLGGRVIKQKTDVPGYGWFAIRTDTENNGFALWEANATNAK